MTDPFTSPDSDNPTVDGRTVKRDRYGRYLLPHPTDEDGNEISWTRATTFASTLSDTYSLNKWSERMLTKGLTLRPDLYAQAASVPLDDRDQLNKIAEQAKEAAGSKTAATMGTAIHSFTEQVDGPGEDPVVPHPWDRDIAAYKELVTSAGFEFPSWGIERIVVIPEYQVAGTFDRIARLTKPITVKFPKKDPIHLEAGTWAVGDVKGLALTEKIPTPSGWTTMGDIRVGDTVFDGYGKQCRVTGKSEVKRIGTYIVRFSDGSSVVCDSEHIWWTQVGYKDHHRPLPRTIQEIRNSLYRPNGQPRHRVPVPGPLELPEADLPIDPYLLGVWLGDGNSHMGQISGMDDIFEVLMADGVKFGKTSFNEQSRATSRVALGLVTELRKLDLLQNKHIPDIYMRSSVDQRLRLLQGLMDSDGTWNTARESAVFYNQNKGLILQVEELLLSLGQRPRSYEVRCTGFGKEVMSGRIEFTPLDINPFRLARKAEQVAASTKSTGVSRWRCITAVEEGPDVESACISVDSPTRTYLCNERMIPTHNSKQSLNYGTDEIAIQLALYSRAKVMWNGSTGQYEPMPDVNQQVAFVFHLPAGKATAKLYAIDIELGWEASKLCQQVRTWRKLNGLAVEIPVNEPTWEEKIATATSRADLSRIWKEATRRGEWTPELENLGKQRAKDL